MEQSQEAKANDCKFCLKRFVSNRALNAHTKSHLTANPNMEAETSNGFREIPERKPLNVHHSHVCKFCGKEFDSPRSLFGHLRHHSAKSRTCKECGKLCRTMKSLVVHTRVHQIRVSDEPSFSPSFDFAARSLNVAENLNWVRRKRSTRIRYKSSASSSSFSSINGDSSVTEIDPEVEHVATCLILLSMGVHDFREDELSDDISDEFEVTSPNQDKKRLLDDHRFPLGSDDQFLKLKKPRFSVPDSQNDSREQKIDVNTESDLGFLANKENKSELHGDEALFCGNKLKVKAKDLQVDASSDAELVHPSSYSELQIDSRKKIEYKCRTCDKVFSSYRALGGHQTGHRTGKSSFETKKKNSKGVLQNETSESKNDCEIETEKLEVVEKSLEWEMGGYESKKIRAKEHKCLICLKIFGSGQALGGHKKIHHSKRSKILCDLNLPAMINDESESISDFNSVI